MLLKQLDSVPPLVTSDNAMIDLVVLPLSFREIETRSGFLFSRFTHDDDWVTDMTTLLFKGEEIVILCSEYTRNMKPEVYVQCSDRIRPTVYRDIVTALLNCLDLDYESLAWRHSALVDNSNDALGERVVSISA